MYLDGVLFLKKKKVDSCYKYGPSPLTNAFPSPSSLSSSLSAPSLSTKGSGPMMVHSLPCLLHSSSSDSRPRVWLMLCITALKKHVLPRLFRPLTLTQEPDDFEAGLLTSEDASATGLSGARPSGYQQ